MLNGLSLFTGIGGIDVALSEYVSPVAYCEIEPYCQSVLLQRMSEGNLPKAPIWNDIRTLSVEELPPIDIIYGGFPCQDISVAGAGKGLEGERSGLFFEIMRLVREAKPTFVFLENVSAIRTRGLDKVLQEFTKERYDCRWTMLSAAEVGARHRRERWFLLAYSDSSKCGQSERRRVEKEEGKETSNRKDDNALWIISGTSEIWKSDQDYVANSNGGRSSLQRDREVRELGKEKLGEEETRDKSTICSETRNTEISDSKRQGLHEGHEHKERPTSRYSWFEQGYWTAKSRICGITNDVSITLDTIAKTTTEKRNRVNRIKALGNSVCPPQVKKAFERLLGLT